ncbi:MAG: DUF4242 domain-containing protein [Anaerolineales bacterium]|nr:DUF4242 domain-containing protein [Anaerolineales bacterium]
MPRYLVERTFPEGQSLPGPQHAPQARLSLIDSNAAEGVTWLHSYIAADRRRSYCLCDAPTPEAVRRAAGRSGLPVDRIVEVRVLDPYFAA